MDDRTELLAAAQRRIRRLEAENARLKGSLEDASIDAACARAVAAEYRLLERSATPPPTVLVHALRSGAQGPWQAVWVPIRHGRQLRVLVDGAAYDIGLAAESAVWEWLQAHADDVPEHPFTRARMPDRLHAVAYGRSIVVSSRLSGQQVIQARRALLPRQRRPQSGSLLSIAAFPAVLMLKALRQVSLSATVAPVSAATAPLPLVTAAAISTPAVVVSWDHLPPPPVVRVERTKPVDNKVRVPVPSPRTATADPVADTESNETAPIPDTAVTSDRTPRPATPEAAPPSVAKPSLPEVSIPSVDTPREEPAPSPSPTDPTADAPPIAPAPQPTPAEPEPTPAEPEPEPVPEAPERNVPDEQASPVPPPSAPAPDPVTGPWGPCECVPLENDLPEPDEPEDASAGPPPSSIARTPAGLAPSYFV